MPPTFITSPVAVVAKYLPVALTVLLKVVACPAPYRRMPATCEPFTFSVLLVPKRRSPVTALISPQAAPLVAAKLMVAVFRVNSPEALPPLLFSILAWVPPLS